MSIWVLRIGKKSRRRYFPEFFHYKKDAVNYKNSRVWHDADNVSVVQLVEKKSC